MNSILGSVVPLAMFVFFTCLKLHLLIATKFFINTYLIYQTLVLFLMAKTSADNLSQGFRTELPLTYRLLSPRPSLPISFPCWPPPCFFFLDHLPALVSLYTAPQQEDGSCSSPAFVSGWRLTEHQRQIPQLRLSRERERKGEMQILVHPHPPSGLAIKLGFRRRGRQLAQWEAPRNLNHTQSPSLSN